MDDLEAIEQLEARYFRAMDTKDQALMRDVFADDVVAAPPGIIGYPDLPVPAPRGLVRP